MLAKRRGYGVLISHNIPPYSRAGLYKELVSLRELISEYREDSQKNSGLRQLFFAITKFQQKKCSIFI